MKEYLKRLPEEVKDLIGLISDTAGSAGLQVYLVGGFVRDMLLGLKNLDLDIVVEGDGIAFAKILGDKLSAKVISHKRFGTATVAISHNLKIDIATSRKESYATPASLPLVKRSVLKDDLARRDFTINAMAINISRNSFGQFLDFFNGRKDLAGGAIRVLHDLSFIDDPTRMIRAVRFEQRYGFRIDPNTLKLFKQAVKRKMLEMVEPQRLRDELILLLKENRPIRQIRRLDQLAGMRFVDPHLKLLKKDYLFLDTLEKQIIWFMDNHAQRRLLDSWLAYLIGMIDQLSLSQVKSWCKKYMFHKGQEKRILSFKSISRKFISELSRPEVLPAKIHGLLDPLSYEVIIAIKAKYSNSSLRWHIEDFLRVYNDMRLHLTGDDLRELGMKPGPHYQMIFRKLLQAKLNGLVKTREEELMFVKQIKLKREKI